MPSTPSDERDELARILAQWRDGGPVEDWAVDMYREAAELILDAGYRRHPVGITDDMVAAALDARASMSSRHIYLYATEKCRCGEEWSDAHWMRFILEAALEVNND